MTTELRTTFLLADDDADDAALFCDALMRISPVMKCLTAENGHELFELLSKEYPDKPDIIFLDINMPIMNGWECLRRLKDSPDFQTIPTIIYSTSAAKTDVQRAYSLGALLFLTKPEDFNELCIILDIVAKNPQESLVPSLMEFKSVRLK